MYMCVYEKRKKERQRRRERGKIKPCFLLSHFQLCEVRATLQRSIELNFNPASSYTHLLYCTVKAVYPNFRHYHQLQPRETSRRRMDGSTRRFHRAMSQTVVVVNPPGRAIISSCGHLNRKSTKRIRKKSSGCVRKVAFDSFFAVSYSAARSLASAVRHVAVRSKTEADLRAARRARHA